MAQPQRAGAQPDEGMLVLTRRFDAPLGAVFRAWTDSQQIQRWWGPNGFTTPYCTIDLRPGGAWHYCMRSPEGRDYWCKGIFKEIVPLERIVTTDFFSDEAGNRVSPTAQGMSTDWPEETEIAVSFAEEDGKTVMTVRQGVSLALAESSGAVQGWNESLDRLAASLTSLCPMSSAPQKEHYWLRKLVGEWSFEGEVTTPDQQRQTFQGRESVRSLGGLWVVAEGTGEMAGEGVATTILSLGYDPRKECYIGTFIGSMMAQMWLYEGSLDASGKILTLATEGPNFATQGETMAKFQDVISFESDDHRILASSILGDDGQWTRFMTAHYRRL